MKPCLSVLLLAAAPVAGQAGGGAQVGDVVDHVFSTPPVNAMGVSSLAGLRGRPVLIDFWGKH